MDCKTNLIGQFKNRTAVVAVMGLGYVGLPLAVIFAEVGFKVIGIDPSQEKVAALMNGESYIMDVPSEKVANLVKSGKLQPTTDFSKLLQAQAVTICVPTPLRKTGDPDISFIVSAADELAKYVHEGMVIVLESSTYPGTTRELIMPRLEAIDHLKLGENIFLAFSPERVDPGRIDWTTKNTPKVVGGITEHCSDVATAWYREALDSVIRVSSAEVAEMTKLLENTFRMINIGMVNELAMICDRMDVDVWEVIEAAATKPFGFMKFTPGPGLGGHCIPIDPLYLSWKLKAFNYTARFIELASEINTNMPRFAVTKIQNALNNQCKSVKGSNILILGIAYKPDINDLRESPALDVIHLLVQLGAQVTYYDPYISCINNEGYHLESVVEMLAAAHGADAVVIVTNHTIFDYPAILEASRLIIDTRNALGSLGYKNPKVIRL